MYSHVLFYIEKKIACIEYPVLGSHGKLGLGHLVQDCGRFCGYVLLYTVPVCAASYKGLGIQAAASSLGHPILLVNDRCTASICSISPILVGCQTPEQYSKRGMMKVFRKRSITSLFLEWNVLRIHDA